MKQILIAILLWTVGCLVGLAQPKATFDKKVHEFGVVLWKHPATATFTIKNDGNKPLVISNVTTSCGCTVADWTKEPIPAGKTGEVKVTFDPKNRPGNFMKTIRLYGNGMKNGFLLSIRGKVLKAE